jgi:hypothetical protein
LVLVQEQATTDEHSSGIADFKFEISNSRFEIDERRSAISGFKFEI